MDVPAEELGQIQADKRGRLRRVEAGPREGLLAFRPDCEDVVGPRDVRQAVVGCCWVLDHNGGAAEDGGEAW